MSDLPCRGRLQDHHPPECAEPRRPFRDILRYFFHRYQKRFSVTPEIRVMMPETEMLTQYLFCHKTPSRNEIHDRISCRIRNRKPAISIKASEDIPLDRLLLQTCLQTEGSLILDRRVCKAKRDSGGRFGRMEFNRCNVCRIRFAERSSRSFA